MHKRILRLAWGLSAIARQLRLGRHHLDQVGRRRRFLPLRAVRSNPPPLLHLLLHLLLPNALVNIEERIEVDSEVERGADEFGERVEQVEAGFGAVRDGRNGVHGDFDAVAGREALKMREERSMTSEETEAGHKRTKQRAQA